MSWSMLRLIGCAHRNLSSMWAARGKTRLWQASSSHTSCIQATVSLRMCGLMSVCTVPKYDELLAQFGWTRLRLASRRGSPSTRESLYVRTADCIVLNSMSALVHVEGLSEMQIKRWIFMFALLACIGPDITQIQLLTWNVGANWALSSFLILQRGFINAFASDSTGMRRIYGWTCEVQPSLIYTTAVDPIAR